MKTKNTLFWVLFIGIILILIFIVSLNYNNINSFIEENVGVYGYPAIFIFSFLSDAIDQPIVVEVPAVLGAIYGLDVLNVFLAGALGISLIGFINFNIGRIVFRKRIKDLCNIKKYSNYCRLFYKYGKLSLLLAALTPLPYVTFGLETDVPMGTFASQVAMESLTYWINCFSSTSAAHVASVADDVMGVMDNATLTVTGYTSMKCVREFIGTVIWDLETGIFQVPLRYRVWLDKT